MSKATDKLFQRLRNLPSDVLADILLDLTHDKPLLKNELVILTSDSTEITSTIKRSIAGLKRSTAFHDYSKAKKYKNKLEDILKQIASVSESSPAKAFELVCEFMTIDGVTLDNVDDSSGYVGDVFRVAAPALAAKIAMRNTDDVHMAKWLCTALNEDPFNARCYFVDALATAVPESVMQAAHDYVTPRVESTPRNDLYEDRQLAFVLRSIIVALGNIERYLDFCTHNGEISSTDILAVVQMHIDHEQFEAADKWLDRLTIDRNADHGRIFQLHMIIDKALGRTARVKEHVRNRFLAQPSQQSFIQASEHLSEAETQRMLDALMLQVQITKPLHLSALLHLITIGKGAELEGLVANYKSDDHYDFYAWSNIARAFEKAHLPLSASVVFRTLLDDILSHARSNAYHIAVYYYGTLWTLSSHVHDWRGLPDNDTYMATVANAHSAKSSFWMLAEGTPKPPRVSKFKL